ncbi:Inner membrane protein YjdF [compost metagenome]
MPSSPHPSHATPQLSRWLIAAGALIVLALLISFINPHDRLTWLMEVMPVLIALPVLALTYQRFPLTPLLYALIFLHALILIVGGTYTYAHVPIGFWVQDVFALARNPYDKLGHLWQGLVPALLAKEIFVRRHVVVGKKMVAFLAICVAMAISAWYELIEWWAALIMGQGADEFLGTQGDQWDTQSDMCMAFIGAMIAVILLARWHDRQLARSTGSKQ